MDGEERCADDDGNDDQSPVVSLLALFLSLGPDVGK
jgi:hypothetical protein